MVSQVVAKGSHRGAAPLIPGASDRRSFVRSKLASSSFSVGMVGWCESSESVPYVCAQGVGEGVKRAWFNDSSDRMDAS